MLRGISTVTLWAEDLPAAIRWYIELAGRQGARAEKPCQPQRRKMGLGARAPTSLGISPT